jgi:hypothetical protein
MESCDRTTAAAVPLADIGPVFEVIACDEVTFVSNPTTFPTSVVESMALWLAVREQLQVDACVRQFAICNREIISGNFSSFRSLLSG